jgi:FKBP-type peptidyl-prolyl cis-trans isomerase
MKVSRTHLTFGLLFFFAMVSWIYSQSPASAPAPAASGPDKEKAYPLSAYAAIGSAFAEGNHLNELGWNDQQIAAFVDGIRAALKGKSYPFDEVAGQASAEMGRRIQGALARQQTVPASPSISATDIEGYMKSARDRLGLQQSDSGLAYRVERGRGGPRPRTVDTVMFSCVATAADGHTKLPQLSVEHARAKMADLFPGFVEGFQMMTVESSAVFVLPPSLSFGNEPWPQGIQPGTPIIFEVTLYEIHNPDGAR